MAEEIVKDEIVEEEVVEEGSGQERPEPPKDENGNPCPPPPHGGPHGSRPDGVKSEEESEGTAPAVETAEV